MTPYAWHLYFDFSLGSNPLGSQTIDSFAVLNHNFNDASSIVDRVGIYVTEANAATPVLVYQSTTTPFPDRFVVPWLTAGGAASYSSVEGVSVRVATASTFGSFVPKIGEVVVGQRIQLPRKAIRPWEPDAIQQGASELVVDSGQTYRFFRGRGRNVKDMTFQVRPLADQVYTTINFSDQIELIRDRTQGYSRPLLWVENPNSAPNDARYMVTTNPRWEAAYEEAALRNFNLKLRELAPFYRNQVNSW